MSEQPVEIRDIRGTHTVPITVEYAWNIGRALSDWLPTDGRILVAWRQSQQALGTGLIEGIRLQGRSVISAGQITQAAAIDAMEKLDAAGGAIVSYDDQEGVATIELYQAAARAIDQAAGLQDITALAASGNFIPAAQKGALTHLA